MSDHLPPNDNPEQPKQVFVRSQLTAIYSLGEATKSIYATVGTNRDSVFSLGEATKNIYATSGTFRDAIEESRSATYRALVKLSAIRCRIRYGALQREEKRPLDGRSLMRLTDWVPSAAVRKRQKKLIADELAEINEYRAEGRMAVARWRRFWLAVHWTGYVLGAPLTAALRLIRKTSAG